MVGNIRFFMRITGLIDLMDQIFGNSGGALAIGIAQKKHKFFTTITGGKIGGSAGILVDNSGNLLQAVITTLMSVIVVIIFEQVDINIEQRDRKVLTISDAPLSIECLIKGAAIGNIGQPIGQGENFQLMSSTVSNILLNAIAKCWNSRRPVASI